VIISSGERKALREEVGERLSSLLTFYQEKAEKYGQCVEQVSPIAYYTILHTTSAQYYLFQLRDTHITALRVLLESIDAQNGLLTDVDVASVKKETGRVISSSQVRAV